MVVRYAWLVEEELRLRFGTPPWLDSALVFVLVEIFRHSRCFPLQTRKAAASIRNQAKRAAKRLEQTIADKHTKNGFIDIRHEDEALARQVHGFLERTQSLYWAELCPRRLVRPSLPSKAHGVLSDPCSVLCDFDCDG